jgi:hypothetical protein
MTEKQTTDGKAPAVDAAQGAPVLNLYQRLATVAKQVGSLAPSGHDQYGKTALSIYDVEEAVRKPLAEAGVITRWSYVSLTPQDKLWIAHLRVTLTNADDREDWAEDDWIDVGSNPMAATSFARKGYYKALFHLDDKESDADKGDRTPPATDGEGRREASTPQGAVRPAGEVECPTEGCDGHLVERHRKQDGGAFLVCSTSGVGKPGCGLGILDGTLAGWIAKEAEFADSSDAPQQGGEPVIAAPASASDRGAIVAAGSCPECRRRGLTTRSGSAVDWYSRPQGGVACQGYDPLGNGGKGEYVKHPVPGEAASVSPDEIPF